MVDAVRQVLEQVPGIVEAYLPQCYIEGDDEAKQVLVVGIASKMAIPRIMTNLMAKMELLMPPSQYIDILPFSTKDLPPEAKVVECCVLKPPTETKPDKPWWKFW